jgi:nitrogen regulatory protein PII
MARTKSEIMSNRPHIHRAKIETFVPGDQLDQVVKVIIEITMRGKPKDDIITVLNLEQVISILTREEGEMLCVQVDFIIASDH